MKIRNIELLAPARNAETGIEAIRHGADAVYIGAPQFSARAAAGNSLEDITRLVEFAHQFDARVYVALNTILTDEQLPDAEALIHSLYKIGVDAIIVQDMGILSLNLPPIAIHASTQTDNRTVEKVKFMEECGFSQVVLARELTLPQIKEIASNTKVPLEVFVHGALCVSYSGQCYVSQAYTNRSANRGECAQFCRLPYRLEDANGKVIATNQHLLSLKDMNRSESLEQLLDAGVTSLKIEGRLKDISYVKNITAYYRQKLDQIFKRRPEYRAASSGETANLAPSVGRGDVAAEGPVEAEVDLLAFALEGLGVDLDLAGPARVDVVDPVVQGRGHHLAAVLLEIVTPRLVLDSLPVPPHAHRRQDEPRAPERAVLHVLVVAAGLAGRLEALGEPIPIIFLFPEKILRGI